MPARQRRTPGPRPARGARTARRRSRRSSIRCCGCLCATTERSAERHAARPRRPDARPAGSICSAARRARSRRCWSSKTRIGSTRRRGRSPKRSSASCRDVLLLIAMRPSARGGSAAELERIRKRATTSHAALDVLAPDETRALVCQPAAGPRAQRAGGAADPARKRKGIPSSPRNWRTRFAIAGFVHVEHGVCRFTGAAAAAESIQLPNTVQVMVEQPHRPAHRAAAAYGEGRERVWSHVRFGRLARRLPD